MLIGDEYAANFAVVAAASPQGGGVLRQLGGSTCRWVIGMILGERNYSLIEEDTPMTLSDTATAYLSGSFRVGGGAGLVREAVELVPQELIEA